MKTLLKLEEVALGFQDASAPGQPSFGVGGQRA